MGLRNCYAIEACSKFLLLGLNADALVVNISYNGSQRGFCGVDSAVWIGGDTVRLANIRG